MTNLDASLNDWQPRMLSVLRIMAGLLFLQYGLMKHLSFPAAYSGSITPFSLTWFAGAIELVGGIFLVLGLFTRSTAFVCSGLMAFAYFLGHAPRGVFPLQNGGNLAIIFCFVFFYLIFAGPGRWSIDAARSKQS